MAVKVFLSWSGILSHKVALAFRDWLPLVIQSVGPYVSSEDIEMGAPWDPELDRAMTESCFGIICLTADNQNSRWLNYEAGVLSKAIGNPKTRVSPFLFNLRPSEMKGPLTRFQSTLNEKNAVWKLVSAVNNAGDDGSRLNETLLEKGFSTYWPELEAKLIEIADNNEATSHQPARDQMDILVELLELVRGQQRLVVTKDDLIGMMLRFDKEQSTTRAALQGYFPFGSHIVNLASVRAYGDPPAGGIISQKGGVEIEEALGPLSDPNTENFAKDK